MTKLLKTAAIAAVITGFANTAYALTPHDGSAEARQMEMQHVGSAEERQVVSLRQDKLTRDDRIAVARLDGGRFIATPHDEEVDWTYLNKRVDLDIEILSAGAHFKYLPQIDFQGARDTDNKIDEIRLAAANEGYSHIILYGLDADAYWASFGGKALSETGLTFHEDCGSWDEAAAKALLVNTHTGEVLGAATADDVTYNIGQLADDMERVLTTLT